MQINILTKWVWELIKFVETGDSIDAETEKIVFMIDQNDVYQNDNNNLHSCPSNANTSEVKENSEMTSILKKLSELKTIFIDKILAVVKELLFN